MEEINQELEAKMIEKSDIQTTVVDEVQPKVKKPRSEAQIKAFEKARAKRMENLKNKEKEKDFQKQVEEVVAPDPQLAVDDKSVSFNVKPDTALITPQPTPSSQTPQKKKRGRPKGVKNKKVMKHQEPPPTGDRPYYPHPVEHNIPQPQLPQYNFQGQQGQVPLNPYQQYHYYQPPQQPQAPVNNYYYYGTPPPNNPPPQPQQEEVIQEPSSEEEVVEFEEEPPQEIYQPALRYRFV